MASIVEKISGQHFKDFLKEKITDPIGMDHTTLYKYQIAEDKKMPNRAYGYTLELNQKDFSANDYDFLNDVRGDGGIYSTLEDLYKWNMALANHTIISKAYLDEAFTSGQLNNGEKTNYGFGWFIESESNEPLVVSHSGGWVGFATFLYNEIDAKSGFIVLTNYSGENYGAVVKGFQAIEAGEPYSIPKTKISKVMAKTIYNTGIDNAIKQYGELKNTSEEAFDFKESELNILGYELLNANKVNEALAVFKLNAEVYPESANVYDSYGDALLEAGDSLKALEHFRKSFAMDNSLDYSEEKAEALEKLLIKK